MRSFKSSWLLFAFCFIFSLFENSFKLVELNFRTGFVWKFISKDWILIFIHNVKKVKNFIKNVFLIEKKFLFFEKF